VGLIKYYSVQFDESTSEYCCTFKCRQCVVKADGNFSRIPCNSGADVIIQTLSSVFASVRLYLINVPVLITLRGYDELNFVHLIVAE